MSSIAGANQCSIQPTLKEHPFVTPFFKYHGRVIKTFSKLPEHGRLKEIVTRIIIAVSTIVVYPVVSLLALTGIVTFKKTPTPTHIKPFVPPFVEHKVSVRTTPAKVAKSIHYSDIQFPGYNATRLKTLQETIDERQLPLHVCPKRPEKSFPVNQEKMSTYLDSLPSPYREVCRKGFANLKHISMEEFDRELTLCVQKFNKQIESQAYSVGLVAGKSSQWVTSLALKDLENLPTSWFSLGRQNTNVIGYNLVIPEQNFTLPIDSSLPLVIFDDCSYSGTQLRDEI